MVAQHYRWDFIGLSSDTKPDATNPKVANGSTYYESDTSKLYVWYNNQWYEKTATGGYELPIASASTLGGVKVGEGLEISEAGVLSATGGGGGGIVTLTEDDYNYPANNPDGVAMWLFPAGIYQFKGIKFYLCSSRYDYDGTTATIIVNPHESEGDVVLWSFSSQYAGLQNTNTSGGDAGFYPFTLQ